MLASDLTGVEHSGLRQEPPRPESLPGPRGLAGGTAGDRPTPQVNDAEYEVFMRLFPSRRSLVLTLCAGLAGVTFIADVTTTQGIQLGMLYSCIVLVTLIMGSVRDACCFALGCTLLLVIGYWISPDTALPEAVDRFNRLLVILMLWTTTLLGLLLEHMRREQEQSRLQLSQLNHQLQQLARNDHLTCIANRRYFDEQLRFEFRRALREDCPLSLMMIDIDFFKSLNDSAGHQAGDACLVCISQLIARSLRRPSDFVARYGGEEFALLLPGTDLAGAVERAEAVRAEIEATEFEHGDGGRYRVTISIGVATVYPAHSSHEAEFLVASADRALYMAKADGRNCVRASGEAPRRIIAAVN